jgi:hypothetical protein
MFTIVPGGGTPTLVELDGSRPFADVLAEWERLVR